ncbi:RAB3A-interacting protein, putative [Pediculus humanus corporis]|uniref:RAB3A-interacting protein, putative n=1 Tax=Pediculus humanus subsp. corporis TaxID=121224 RepID=E0V9B4_PEDHC|nr:RAB3A-interacting protein, putative [Pediculus humanus corporis]EEB09970.1 RAB3A-interacting protein, putative [Pediculus humanus corporis]
MTTTTTTDEGKKLFNGKKNHDANPDEIDGVVVIAKKPATTYKKTIGKPEIVVNNYNSNIDICDSDDVIVETNGQNKTDSESSDLSFDRTLADRKEQAFAKLQDELEKAHMKLKLKDEEVARLTRIREDVERELEELTASLFQEAHKMVSKAKEKQAAAEKSLMESQMKVDVLTAEVVALKTLVLTSTPSRPNPHLHPQIGKEENNGGTGVNLFNRKHRRSPSHYNLKYGRENSPPDSPIHDKNMANNANNAVPPQTLENRDISEVDPTVHKEFLNWSLNCKLDKTDPFIDRIYREDINLCLDFSNRELAEQVQKAIETRNIYIEALNDKSKTIFPRMKLGDEDTWYNISQMCRNRIIAVCDFINYLRYIELGLVKSSAHDMYWEIMRLKKEMVLSRLGLSLPSC